jgi:antitoxin ParD1/3/4
MADYTSLSLGDHFDEFIADEISKGRFEDASGVILAGLHLLEEEEKKITAVKKAIQEVLDNGFDYTIRP